LRGAGHQARRPPGGVVATLGVSAQLEVNPVELLDFLVGLTSLDLLGDDPWQPKEEEKKE